MTVNVFYNWPIVALSIAIAIFGSFTALNLSARLREVRGTARAWWMIAAALALGGGIWSMHFIGMLGLVMPMPISYDGWATAASLLLALAGSGAGLFILSVFGSGWKPVAGAGMLVASGIVAMHYIGMDGMEMPGLQVSYNPWLVLASVGIAYAAATTALSLSLRTSALKERLSAALIMGVAISGMHYTGIAAARFSIDDQLPVISQHLAIQEHGLIVIVAGSTLGLLILALVVAYFDRQLELLAAKEAVALRQSAELLREQNHRFKWAINHMAQGLCMFDRNKRLVVSNRQYAELYGVAPEDVQAGQTFDDILALRDSAGIKPVVGIDAFRDARMSVAAGGEPRADVVELGDGRVIQILHRGLPDGGWVATHEDITEQRQMEAKIRFLAQHDPLTNLPNRAFFMENMIRVEPRLQIGEVFSVLLLDLDSFKPVNDTYGHSTGDAVLAAVARRVTDCAGANSFVARLGGDEFAIVHGPIKRPEVAADLARRLVQSLSEAIRIDGQDIRIGSSVGIAVGPVDGTDTTSLMRNADLALYRAKAAGRGTYHFFEPGMDAALATRKRLEADLGRALQACELHLVYQPLINLEEGRISGFEALLRWSHPQRGDVPPAEFIPVAEDTGLINAIGEWVIEQALRQAAAWPDDIFVAVNLSAVQFRQADLVEVIAAALQASGVAASRIELEITETVLLTNTDEVLRALNQLRQLGLKIALDDFGTGYSSLTYLQTFPFDKLKIDRSFLKDVSSRPESKAILKAAAALGRSLGMITTAEGVETIQQLMIVREQGYIEVQGYLLSRPLPAARATKFLEGSHASTLMAEANAASRELRLRAG